MSQPAAENPSLVECGWAGAALEGGPSGDLHVVKTWPQRALLAVIDGLGHGPEAAEAAHEAAAVLQAGADDSVHQLMLQCHEALRKTRGAVMSLALVDARRSTLDWCGVGNVEARLLHRRAAGRRAREAISVRGGVLGCRLPAIQVKTLQIDPGDLLVFATDGIRSDFCAEIELDWSPQATADWLLRRYSKSSDDALVLVARYLGAGAG